MNKTIATMLPALLLLGMAAAFTQVDLSVVSPSGYTSFMEKSTVKGNYWDWPNEPVPRTATATIKEAIHNEGSLRVQKSVTTFGTGLQWPDIAEPGEWSMLEDKRVQATGRTTKHKEVDVWTVHPDWYTDYAVWEKDVTNTATHEFESVGQVQGGHYKFTKTVFTDEPIKQFEKVWINPFGEA